MAKNTKSQSVARVPEEGRAKALEAVMAQIDKNYGKGAVMRLGDKEITKTEVISTGAIALDAALGIAVCPAVASSRFTVPSPPVRPPLRCTL